MQSAGPVIGTVARSIARLSASAIWHDPLALRTMGCETAAPLIESLETSGRRLMPVLYVSVAGIAASLSTGGRGSTCTLITWRSVCAGELASATLASV